jgi:hypothetical protein
LENIIDPKIQKVEAAFAAQMQLCLPLSRNLHKNLLLLPLLTAKGRPKLRNEKFCLEDIQLIPTSSPLQLIFEIEILTRRYLTSFQSVSRSWSTGSTQARDSREQKAILAFDAAITTKRTPLKMDIGVDVQVEGRPSTGTINDLSRVGQRLLAKEFDVVGI